MSTLIFYFIIIIIIIITLPFILELPISLIDTGQKQTETVEQNFWINYVELIKPQLGQFALWFKMVSLKCA